MQLLKNAADPHNLLNPGKMLDAPPMDTHLRYGEDYRAEAWAPVLDFARNNGLAGAIQQCNGQGVCRKDTGVMCPSFQATREEGNSTRGRANLLWALTSFPVSLQVTKGSEAISSLMRLLRRRDAVPRNDALGESVYHALDLCLACKGCKAECPSGVDMAKLKYEFQHEYYKSHRRKLRDHLFAYIGPLAQLGAPFGKLVNWSMEQRFVRGLVNPIFGLAEKRELPKFAPQLSMPASRFPDIEYCESVILLRDTFTHFFEPEIERAALDMLTACGVEVKVLPYFSAGRTLISKGFLEPARRHAERVFDAIQKLDPEGKLPVLGIEPSELYTLRDEFLDLLPERRADAEALASRAWLVEEYLVRPGADNKSRILRVTDKLQDISSQNSPKLLLHGHCYQKAQPPAADGCPVGQNASAELLRTVGYEVKIIPSGCCGMAGAFGYEDEHYELSMQVGELALFPIVREAMRSGNEVSAVGTSCRSQIADGTGVAARHPLVLSVQRLGSMV